MFKIDTIKRILSFASFLFPYLVTVTAYGAPKLDIKTFSALLITKQESPLCLNESVDFYTLQQIYVIQEHVEVEDMDVCIIYIQYSVYAACKSGGRSACEDQVRLCKSNFELDHKNVTNDVTKCQKPPGILSNDDVGSRKQNDANQNPCQSSDNPSMLKRMDDSNTKVQEDSIGCDKVDVQKLAESGVSDLNQLNRGKPLLKLVKVHRARRQRAENGIVFLLELDCEADVMLTCSLDLLLQPWLSSKPQILQYECFGTDSVVPIDSNVQNMPGEISKGYEDSHLVDISNDRSSVKPQQLQMPQGTNDGLVHAKFMAEYAMIELDEIDPDNNRRVVIDILSIRKQVTLERSGVVYSLSILMVSTACEETHYHYDNQDCINQPVAPPKTCNIDLVQSWTAKDPCMVNSECLPCSPDVENEHKLVRRQNGRLNSPINITCPDQRTKDAINFVVGVISDGSSSEKKLGLLKIVNGTSQVVSGTLYTFKIQVANTSCDKDDSSMECKVDESADESDADFNECDVKCWDQPWRTPRYKINSLICIRPNANTVQ